MSREPGKVPPIRAAGRGQGSTAQLELEGGSRLLEAESISEEGPDGEEFVVEAILDKASHRGQPVYLVKWVGYGQDGNTWEPAASLAGCDELLKAYEKRSASKRKRSKPRKSGVAGRKTAAPRSPKKLVKEPVAVMVEGDGPATAEGSGDVSGETQWQVEAIVGVKRTAGKALYEVKWKGWASSENTWQERDTFASLATPAYFDFRQKLRKKISGVDAKLASQRRPASGCV